MKRGLVVVALAVGCVRPPLGPGETRCHVEHNALFGDETKCQSGPPMQAESDPVATAPPAPPAGWWCTVSTDPGDEYGVCARNPGHCEEMRAQSSGHGYSPCAHQATAICSQAGCFASPAACFQWERSEHRSGDGCVARQ